MWTPTARRVAIFESLVNAAYIGQAAGRSRSNVAAPGGKVPAGGTSVTLLAAAISNPTTMAPLTQAGSIPHENQQPYLAVNFIIALSGVFPTRS